MATSPPHSIGPQAQEYPDGYETVSPVTGEPIGRVRLWTAPEIVDLLESDPRPPEITPRDVFAFLARLRAAVEAHRSSLIQMTLLETGYVEPECRELVDAAIEYLRDFEMHALKEPRTVRTVPHSYASRGGREMRIVRRPFRAVAALVPQNASLPLSITIIASALYAGARLLLRPSLQCAPSGVLLAELVAQSDPPSSRIHIVNSLATEFLAASCAAESVDMIHYIGSNRFALDVFNRAFSARKSCLLDGQGNGLLYVDETFPVEEAVRLIAAGATRYNGETCTSVNGVLAHARVFPEIRDALVETFRGFQVGDPTRPGVHIGPLFSRSQAEDLARALAASGGRVLCGGTTDGAYFTPAVLEGIPERDPIAMEGFFGPAVWISRAEEEGAFEWFHRNQFPLSDTILSAEPELIRRFGLESRAARICVNQDPSIESMFEPWGGYPPSGCNIVSDWIDKYRQPYQLDGSPEQLAQLAVTIIEDR